MDRDIRNVLIRDLTDEDRYMIKEVMRDTGVGSASKALIRAGHSFCRQSKVIERLRDRNRELEAENIALRRGRSPGDWRGYRAFCYRNERDVCLHGLFVNKTTMRYR